MLSYVESKYIYSPLIRGYISIRKINAIAKEENIDWPARMRRKLEASWAIPRWLL